MRCSLFLSRMFEFPRRCESGDWVAFRDAHPDTLTAWRFDDFRDGEHRRPVCVMLTPDVIKIHDYPGAFNMRIFPRDKAWDALECIDDLLSPMKNE